MTVGALNFEVFETAKTCIDYFICALIAGNDDLVLLWGLFVM